jgi:pimeloyl-ACP methyl ester carboxylesterase
MMTLRNSAAMSPDEKPVAAQKPLARNITGGGAAYYEAGAGEALVLVHGVGMRLEAWAPQIEALAKSHRVIAVDLPGHGESAKLPSDSTIREYVAWFGQFLDDMQIERTNLAGHSMGAMISGGAVATFPDRIQRIAYLNGVHRRDAAAKAAVLTRAAEIPRTGVDKAGPLQRWFGDDANSRHARELTRDWLDRVDLAGYATAYKAFAHGDEVYADCWSGVTSPAMFLTGSDDPNSTPGMAETMASISPNGWAEIIQGHRHMVNLTAPDLVTGLLLNWLVSDEKRTVAF